MNKITSRTVVLDTETTGLHPMRGDRVVEIGLVELIDRRPTGRHYHVYINPERHVPEGAVRVHGLDDDRLKNEPKFAEIVDDFEAFVDGAEIVIHNAPFDMGFLNMELALLGRPPLDCRVHGVIDTLVIAREESPGKRNSLDALCERYGVPNKHRTLHGALLDAELLGDVYLCMTRGQEAFGMEFQEDESYAEESSVPVSALAVVRSLISEEEMQEHMTCLAQLRKDAGGKPIIWDTVLSA